MYISMRDIKNKYGLKIGGIIHLGAHLGEEAKDYSDIGCEKVIWIEGNPSLIQELKSNVSIYDQNSVYNVLISDIDKSKVIFNITEFSQSSSVLDLGITKEIHDTKIKERRELTARRIDSFFSENNINWHPYNFLNIDLQGYELTALKSMGALLDNIDWIYTEVNSRSLYKNCTLLDELDLFLLKNGFKRVELHMTDWYWGDALYKRESISRMDYISGRIKILGWSVKNRIFGPISQKAAGFRRYLGKIRRNIFK
jgi:FkbM family methyltransferase